MLIYGFLITLISVYQPQGIWGLFAKIGKKKNG
jgi:ABC-type branched-subunit amino acid transport system permease subunit